MEISANAEKDIEFIQNELKRLLSDRELCSILGEECTDRMAQWDSMINQKKKEPFSLMVIGDFKRGKSTIINAILGQNVAPTNVAPETFTINCISYGEVPSTEAVLKNGKRVSLMKNDLCRDRLSELLDFFPGELDYIAVRSDAPILKEIRIVDTPGLSDLDELDSQVKEFLFKADAIIYVASALSPFSESEQFFIASHIVPLNFSRLFVLVNMIDAMNTMEDIQKIVNRVQERCDSIMPNAVVYGISGIDEYRRKIGLNRPDIKGFQDYYENEFLKFEMALKREIIVQKDTIRQQRVFSMLKIMLGNTLARLKMISDMERIGDQSLDIIEIVEYVKKCDRESKQYIEEMSNAAGKMVSDSVEAFVRKDEQLAKDVIASDDKVDSLFDIMKKRLIETISKEQANGEMYIDLIMIAKYYERIGDHATNIAEWVLYYLTGTKVSGNKDS